MLLTEATTQLNVTLAKKSSCNSAINVRVAAAVKGVAGPTRTKTFKTETRDEELCRTPITGGIRGKSLKACFDTSSFLVNIG